jgi:hypothetical protein
MAVFAPHSKTFYQKAGDLIVATEDRAKTFGRAYEINVPGWTFSAGLFAASGDLLVVPIIASATPLAATCPCLGVATSTDKGATWTAQVIAQASEFNPSGTGDTAHYPFAAADPKHAHKYAVAAYTPDRKSMQVFWTEDDGDTWNNAAVGPVTVTDTVARAGKIAVGYTSNGKILAVWRAFYTPDNPNVAGGPGWFDTYAALLHGDHFGPTVRVSPQSSKYPTRTTWAPTSRTRQTTCSITVAGISRPSLPVTMNSRLSVSRTLPATRTRARWTRTSPGSRSS